MSIVKLILGSIVGVLAAVWTGVPTIVHALIFLMILDTITGIFRAALEKTLNSQDSFKGIARKLLILALVVTAAIVQHDLAASLNLPLAQLVTGFYCAHEAVSIMENAALAGLPVPQFLKDVLLHLEQQGAKEEGKDGG
ncbi:MAG: phage holin family protein [Caldilineaceae bacterium]